MIVDKKFTCLLLHIIEGVRPYKFTAYDLRATSFIKEYRSRTFRRKRQDVAESSLFQEEHGSNGGYM
jgi:hypothetical protein